MILLIAIGAMLSDTRPEPQSQDNPSYAGPQRSILERDRTSTGATVFWC